MKDTDFVKSGQRVFDIEIEALRATKEIIGGDFEMILHILIACGGKIVMTGMGKSGHVARKIAATFSSLGRPAVFLHPAEALHGDLGMISPEDVVILISNSGENDELIHMLPSIKLIGATSVSITSAAESTLARECDCCQVMPAFREACALDLAPTSSTTAVLAYGDALAVTLSEYDNFTENDFALFHPSGMLGKKVLMKVQDVMAKDSDIPVVRQGAQITDAIMEMNRKMLGMLIVSDDDNRVMGLLTDGDLRRAIERKVNIYEDCIDDIMTRHPLCIRENCLAVKALQDLKTKQISSYPVVDAEGRIVGALTWQMLIRQGIVI